MQKNKLHTTLIFSFALLYVGCGKEVTNNRAPASEDFTGNQGLQTNTVKLKALIPQGSTNSVTSSVKFSKALEVFIPRSIDVSSGNAANQTAHIYFDANSIDDYTFYCKYIGSATTTTPNSPDEISKGLKYDFHDCYSLSGDNGQINYKPGDKITHYPESSVILELNGSDLRFNTEASTILELKW